MLRNMHQKVDLEQHLRTKIICMYFGLYDTNFDMCSCTNDWCLLLRADWDCCKAWSAFSIFTTIIATVVKGGKGENTIR